MKSPGERGEGAEFSLANAAVPYPVPERKHMGNYMYFFIKTAEKKPRKIFLKRLHSAPGLLYVNNRENHCPENRCPNLMVSSFARPSKLEGTILPRHRFDR
jgi:hypothetical protein